MKVSKAEQRRVEIATLAASQPGISQREIAEALSVSTKTVQRAMNAHSEAIERRREEYRRQLAEKSPIEDRANRLVELIKQKEQPMVALKALMYGDQIEGIGPERESGAETQQQPLFALPPGTVMAVKVG